MEGGLEIHQSEYFVLYNGLTELLVLLVSRSTTILDRPGGNDSPHLNDFTRHNNKLEFSCHRPCDIYLPGLSRTPAYSHIAYIHLRVKMSTRRANLRYFGGSKCQNFAYSPISWPGQTGPLVRGTIRTRVKPTPHWPTPLSIPCDGDRAPVTSDQHHGRRCRKPICTYLCRRAGQNPRLDCSHFVAHRQLAVPGLYGPPPNLLL